MYRNGVQFIAHNQHNFVLNHGALGDVICSLPALVFARKTHPKDITFKVWAPAWQLYLLRHLLSPYGSFELYDYKDFPLKAIQREGWDGGPVSLNAPPHNTHTRNRVHMVDFAFNYLLDAQPENMEQRSYTTEAPLGPAPLPMKYVVFPTGATSDNKLFKAELMGTLIEWVHSRGFLPVLVGTKTSHTHALMQGCAPEPIVIRDEVEKLPGDIRALCRDLREKTTLLELRDLCGHAAAVVGVDGGTLHLAGTTNAKIVYAMGTTLPHHRYIPRNGDPHYNIFYVGPRDLECAGCQSRWTMMVGHDFRFCAYGDNKCMDMLHPTDFINALKELGL